MLPSSLTLKYSRAEIDERIREMGAGISEWAAELHRKEESQILALPILRGAIFFFSDLLRRIPYSVEMAPVRTWGYDTSTNTLLTDGIKIDLSSVDAKGRHILLLDDICDSGKTLAVLARSLRDAGAADVRSAVLLKRDIPENVFKPDWQGFSYSGKEWFVGYGMDLHDSWRNLPDVYLYSGK